MPIKQEQMIEQMEEARAAHNANRRLRDTIITYLSMLPTRYPNNPIVNEIIQGLGYAVNQSPIPDDRITFDNERYYKRHARLNSKYRQRQEIMRRAEGIPTRAEALVMLHAKNQLRAEGEEFPQTYEQFNAGKPPPMRQKRSDAKRGSLYKRQAPIFPRTHEDDKPLEFDGPPTGDENSSASPTIGLDIPPDPYDNGDT